ncbi:MAG: hypothetical protein HFF90_01790 [Oscillibacter sp.]|nr:hypothetical protein [Oscillibacter sp.]
MKRRRETGFLQFKKIVRIIIMAIITASVLAACGTKPEDREARASAALSAKYHQEFEITQVYPQRFGDLYYEVQAYPAGDPQILFNAAIDTEDDQISDTYVERRVCAAIAQKAAENLDALPGYYYLFTHAVGPQPYSEDPAISIADYLALNAYNKFRVYLFVVPEEKKPEAFYEAMTKLMEGMDGLNGWAELMIVNDEQMEAVQAFFEEHDSPDFDFSQLTKDYFSLEIPYEKSVIGMSGEAFCAAVKEVL